MRLLLLHNRIYRAFPELDRYSDERCLKFMRVAQRGWMRRVFHVAIILLPSALALFAVVAATRPWGYRLRSPEAPPADPRPCVLYSFGEVRIDNGGLTARGYPYSKALTNAGARADFIINEWRPSD